MLLAKYVMQNGTSFIDMVRTKQAGNPEYDFLHPGGKNNAFFRWALYATGCGISVDQPPPEGFIPPTPQPVPQQQAPVQQHYMPQVQQQFAYAQQQPLAMQQYQQYPPQAHYQQPMMQQQQQQPLRPTPPSIPPEVAGGFSQVLDALTGSKVRLQIAADSRFECINIHVYMCITRCAHVAGQTSSAISAPWLCFWCFQIVVLIQQTVQLWSMSY